MAQNGTIHPGAAFEPVGSAVNAVRVAALHPELTYSIGVLT